jgi:ribosomal protein S18 acetylase RimI-like enzyme
MDTVIREVMESDIEQLIDLSRRTISASYRPFLGDAVDAYIESGAIDQYVQEHAEHCSVIIADGQVAGYAVTKDDLIDLMMIDRDFHRGGLGTTLLRHTEDVLFQFYDEIVLESFEDNHQANNFYRKNGWTEVKIFMDDASGVNKILFKKTAREKR